MNEVLRRVKSALVNDQMPELLKSVGGAFLLRAAGAALAFLLNVAVGRLLGASGAGLYYLSLSVISFAAVIARLGLENTVLRFVASFKDDGDWGQVRGVLRYALIRVGCFSLVLSGVIFIFSKWMEVNVFDSPGMAQVLIALCISVFSFNFMIVLSEALKALGQITNAMLIGGAIYPFAALLVIYPAISLLGVAGAGAAYTFGTLVASTLGLVLWNRSLSRKAPASAVNAADMRASSRPLWGMTIIHKAFLPWTPVIMLGLWASPADAGVFGAATRVATLVSFFLVAVNAVVGPRISVFYARGEINKIKHLTNKSSRLLAIAITPLALGSLFLSSQIMGLFGKDFSQSGLVLSILLCGQLVNGITGPVEFILMMSGRERIMRNIVIISMLVMLVLSVMLIPSYGDLGAAIASACAAATTSIISLIAVYIQFGFWVTPINFQRK